MVVVVVVVVLADWSVAAGAAEPVLVLSGSTWVSVEEAQCSGFPSVMTASCGAGVWSFVISWAESETEMINLSKEDKLCYVVPLLLSQRNVR